MISILLPEGTDRSAFILAMTAAGIGTSVHYTPLHRMPYWKETYSLVSEDFPQAEARFWRTVSLPLYPSLKPEEVDRVCDHIRSVLGGA